MMEYYSFINSRRYRPLSARAEADLSRRIQRGDSRAKNELIRCNMRFVIRVAHLYSSSGIPFEDLVQAGNIGLIRAAEKFEWRRGIKFISYAVWWVRQAMLREIAEQSRIVRIPLNVANGITRGRRNAEKAEQAALSAVEAHIQADSTAVSMSATVGQSETLTLGETIPHVDEYDDERFDMLQIIDDELSRLDTRERFIVRAFYGLDGGSGMPLDEIGEVCGITRERVRQIRNRAIERIQDSTSAERLRDYCG